MTELTAFERNLATALNDYVGPRRPVDTRAISRAAMATSGTRGGTAWRMPFASMQRLAWVALIGLTLVTMVALAIGFGREQPRPTTVLPTAPISSIPAVVVPTSPSPAPTQVDTSAYVALFMRADDNGGADLFAALPDGYEQLLRHFPPLAQSEVDTDITATNWEMSPYAQISNTGWLAMQLSNPDAYAFFDLKDPTRKPWLLPYWAAVGGAWSPQGLFAAVDSDGSGSPSGTLIVDPEAHTTRHLAGKGAIGGGPTVYWAADGSGVLGQDGSTLGIFPAAGGPFVAGLPPIADRRGGRPFGPAGTFLCGGIGYGPGVAGAESCPGTSLSTRDFNGETTSWSAFRLDSGPIVDAGFKADGSGLWAMSVDDSAAQPITMLRIDAPGRPPVELKINRAVLPEPGVHLVEAGFSAIAPDDSIMVIGQGFSIAGEPQLAATYLATDGSGAFPHFGLPVGFVRSAQLASLFSGGPITTPVPRPGSSATAP